MFSLICVWTNDWVNSREAGDLRRYRAHSDVIVMALSALSHYLNQCCDIVNYTHRIKLQWNLHTFSFDGMHLKMSSAKWRPFCLGFNVLTMLPITVLSSLVLMHTHLKRVNDSAANKSPVIVKDNGCVSQYFYLNLESEYQQPTCGLLFRDDSCRKYKIVARLSSRRHAFSQGIVLEMHTWKRFPHCWSMWRHCHVTTM